MRQSRQHPELLGVDGPLRGKWPSDVSQLPFFLTEQQLAYLLDKTVRTLQRYRRDGKCVPFRRAGRTILYARADVLDFIGTGRT